MEDFESVDVVENFSSNVHQHGTKAAEGETHENSLAGEWMHWYVIPRPVEQTNILCGIGIWWLEAFMPLF